VTGGLEAFGYIDRDGLPDTTLNSDAFVKAHPVYEIEGFICVEAIFEALAVYHGIEQTNANFRYQAFLKSAKGEFMNVLFNKEVLNRSKKRAEIMLVALMNPIKPDPDLNKIRTSFETASPAGGWEASFQAIFKQEETRLANSLAGSPDVFLRDFSAKSYYSHAAANLDMTPDAIVRILCQALKLTDKEASENKKLATLRDALVMTLTPIMWPRQA
jgi:hypothetical protein